MYMVYWTEIVNGAEQPHAQRFDSGDLTAVMAFMEALRARRRQGEPLCFVAMASEHPDAVGQAGVADPSSGYNWKKRRR